MDGTMLILLSRFCCGLLLLIVGTPFSLAGEATQSLRFAQELHSQGEFYRAVTEYKRVLFQAPTDSTRIREAAILGIAGAMFAGGEPGRASGWLLARLQEIETEAVRQEALLLMYRSFLADKDGSRLITVSRELGDSTAQGTLYGGLALAQMGNWNEAAVRFGSLKSDERYGPTASAYLGLTLNGQSAEWKSPTTATLLGIVPGLGYWYAGHRQTAVASLLVNAVFAGAAIQAFRTDQTVIGGFVGLFAASWYAGNVYGASRAAKRFNERLQESVWSEFDY